MAIDTHRRSTLKILALATGSTLAPAIATAACKHGVKTDAIASTTIRGTGLTVSFGAMPSSDGSRQVIITNTTDNPVTLSQVYPGIVSTPEGLYDLNSLLVNGTREFGANQSTTLTINIEPNNHAKLSYGQESLKHQQALSMRTADSFIQVQTTNTSVNGGQPVITVREVFS